MPSTGKETAFQRRERKNLCLPHFSATLTLIHTNPPGNLLNVDLDSVGLHF